MADQEDVELTSPHKHIKNTSTCGTVLTENQLKASRRSLIQPKLKERFPHNWVGQKKKVIGTGPVPLGGSCGRGKARMGSPSPLESLHQLGGPPGQIEEPEGPALCPRGVCVCWLVSSQGTERLALMAATSPTSQPETHFGWGCQYTEQVGAETWASVDEPWERTQSSYAQTAPRAWSAVQA